MVQELSCRELAQRLEQKSSICLLDVREDWEVEICMIGESVHIPLSELHNRFGELSQDRPIAIICHHGVRSRHAGIFLEEYGFKDVFNVTGGIDVWALEIAPDMTRYD
ncbi:MULTISPECIES: rhodanese-like domain-containing protein [Thalassospira]|uniref:Sulfurtransferase n=1 Tax=Thalassospira profundimaris TaxID=502049 RepID=A0A367VYW7_9PROT|nr:MULTISPECIES: rhodanese-like domain-containing protein [Thalassospira]RCK31342.1 sulfurtransferase [Thalassospira profundimaris]